MLLRRQFQGRTLGSQGYIDGLGAVRINEITQVMFMQREKKFGRGKHGKPVQKAIMQEYDVMQ